MIEGCQEISDFARAAEWTACPDDVVRRSNLDWFRSPRSAPCTVARSCACAAPMTRPSMSSIAPSSATSRPGRPTPAGLAMSERGDVLRFRGELGAAAMAYEEAIAYGYEPQPGLALLWLAQDRPDAAQAAVRRLLAEPRDPVHRWQTLPAAIEILLATGGEPRRVRS